MTLHHVMADPNAYAEGYAAASGAMQLVLAVLLARQHGTRPDWGLNWLALAMLCAGLVNLIEPSMGDLFGPAGLARETSPLVIARYGLLALAGFSALGALPVGIHAFSASPVAHPLRLFMAVGCGGLVLVAVAAACGLQLGGDVYAMGIMLWCASVAGLAARRNRSLGHALVFLCLLVQPLSLCTLLVFGLDPRDARFIAALPFTLIGVCLIYVASMRFVQRAESGEARFRELFQKAPVPMLLFNLEPKVVAVNKAWEDRTGYTMADLAEPDAWWAQAYPDAEYRSVIRASWSQSIYQLMDRQQDVAPIPSSMVCKDQRVLRAMLGGTRVDAGLLISVTDVTDYHEATRRLEELNGQLEARVAERTDQLMQSTQRLDYVMDATGEGVWDWDVTTGRLYNNARWCTILGRPVDDGLHTLQDFEQHIPEEVRPLVQERLQACLEGGRPYRSEHQMRRADGSLFWVSDRGDVVARDGQGRPLRMVGSFADISERKAAEIAAHEAGLRLAERNHELSTALDQLRRTQNELVRADKLASLGAMVAGIAHEMNTPIGNALVMATTIDALGKSFRSESREGLRRTTLDAFVNDVTEAGQIIERNLSRASELINSFKQVAVDQSSDQRRRFNLRDLVREVLVSLRPSLRKANVDVHVDDGADIPMDSFPGALSQVLINLVDNCIVHAFPQVDCRLIRIHIAPLQPSRVLIEVIDNGVGIPEAVIGRIFDPFFTTRLGRGGSGLGLHLAYNIVTDVLNGHISVRSIAGEGACFSVDIPRQTPDIPVTPPKASQARPAA